MRCSAPFRNLGFGKLSNSQLELYDEEPVLEPCAPGIATLPPSRPTALGPHSLRDELDAIRKVA